MTLTKIPHVDSLVDFKPGPDYDEQNDLLAVVINDRQIRQIVYVRRTSTGIWFVDPKLMQQSLMKLVAVGLRNETTGRGRIDVPSNNFIGDQLRFRKGTSMREIAGHSRGFIGNFIPIHRTIAEATAPTELTLSGLAPQPA